MERHQRYLVVRDRHDLRTNRIQPVRKRNTLRANRQIGAIGDDLARAKAQDPPLGGKCLGRDDPIEQCRVNHRASRLQKPRGFA